MQQSYSQSIRMYLIFYNIFDNFLISEQKELMTSGNLIHKRVIGGLLPSYLIGVMCHDYVLQFILANIRSKLEFTKSIICCNALVICEIFMQE